MTRLNVRDFGTALSFDGVDNYIGVPDAGLPASTFQGGFTLSAWIKPASIGENSSGHIFSKNTSTTGAGGFYLSMQTQDRINFRVNGNTSRNSGVNAAPKGVWTHVCASVLGDGTVNMYSNGVLTGNANQVTGGLAGITTTNDLAIGNNPTSFSRTFDGKIDEPRIWNRALTASEVSELYYNGLTRGSALATGLVGEWLFNEGSGSTAYDTSGNGNHGTITGATYTTDVPMVARGDAGDRKQVGQDLLAKYHGNCDFSIYPDPATNVLTTGDNVWIDGTAAGSASNDTYRWGHNRSGTVAAGFDFSETFNGKPSFKISTLGTNSFSEVYPFPGGASLVGGYNKNAYTKYMVPSERPYQTLKVSYWLKTRYVSGDSNDGARLVLSETTVAGTSAISNNGTNVKTTTDWTYYEFYYNTSVAAAIEYPRMIVYGHTGAATLIMDAWFADIKLEQVFPEQRTLINGNLIRNGDFKYTPPFTAATTTSARYIDGTTGGSTTNSTFAWWLWVLAGSASAQYDTSTLYNGNPNIKVSTTTTSGRAQVRSIGSNTTPPSASSKYSMVQLLPNTQYTFSGAYKTNNVASDSVYGYVREVDGTLATVANQNTTKLTGTNDWTRFSVTFTTGATTRYGFIALLNDVAGNISDAWFADIQLKPTTPQTRQTA